MQVINHIRATQYIDSIWFIREKC